MADVAVLSGPRAELGEGPLWDSGRQILWWVDILGGLVHGYVPGRAAQGSAPAYRHDVGTAATVVLPHVDGGLVVATPEGLARLDPDSGELTVVVELEADEADRRPNDGGCDPAGRVLVGTMPYDMAPGQGRLYRIDTDGRVTLVLRGLTIPNGLGWTRSGTRMHFIDTPSTAVDRFDYDVVTGVMTGRATLIGPDRLLAPERSGAAGGRRAGAPDGMTLDAEDCLWVALYGGSALRRFSPTGELLETVELPVTNPTSCAFGGPGLRDLYVTSASQDAPDGEADAGALLLVQPDSGVPGLPPLPTSLG